MPVRERDKSDQSASLTGEKRPSHIVVFKRPSEKNVPQMAKVLDAKPAQSSVRSACTILKTPDNQADGRVYQGLGVAVADLSPSQVQELEKSDTVDRVVPNRRRTIPRPVDGASMLLAPTPLPQPQRVSDPALAYLLGLRDAADMAARFMQAQQAQPVGESMHAPTAAANGGASSHSWCLSLIGLDEHYSKATGREVVVAVLDTGVDLTHPDFSGRFTEGDTAVSFVRGERVQDGNGHGTHCAGVVGGPANGGQGRRRYGVAPEAQLIVGKVLSDEGSGFDDQIIDGIDWAAHDMGAKVISMSLGALREVGDPFSAPYEEIASVLLEKGVLIFAAAGNESQRPFFTAPVGNPAACPSLWSVAAVDRNRQIASFSCRKMDDIGDVNVSGPGVAVYSTWTGGGYRTISGTSMATPHAAGVAVLFRELHPKLTAIQVRDKLFAACQNLGDSADFGRGLIRVPQ